MCQRTRNREAGERIVAEIKHGEIRQRGWNGKVGQLVDLKIKRNQIPSRVQTNRALNISAARIQVCQREEILRGQRRVRYVQCAADGRIQAWVRDEHGLRQNRAGEAGQNQQGQQEPSDSVKKCFHVIPQPVLREVKPGITGIAQNVFQSRRCGMTNHYSSFPCHRSRPLE